MRPLSLAAVMLAACAPTAPDAPPQPTASVTATPGPGAARIEPLPDRELARLGGELRCGFSDARGLLFAAAADVGRNAAVTARATFDGQPLALRGERAGGFDALRRGGSFGGSGVRITVALGASRPTGHEGARHDALLTLVPTGERPRVATGRWECGP